MAAEAEISVRSWWQSAASAGSIPVLYDALILASTSVPAPDGAGNVVARASHLASGFDVSLAFDRRDAEGATQ
jgi:hypothetical protein